jgi:putative adenylate-forming enzyme
VRVVRERRAQERSCGWTRAHLERQQAVRLAELRRFALERSPFYRRLHQGLETRPLEDLPIVTKAMLMESFDEVLTDRSVRLADLEAFLRQSPGPHRFRGRYIVLSTSGSTGRRGIFVFSDREWVSAIASITRPISWQRAGPGSSRPVRSALIASSTWWHYSARVGMTLSSRLLPTLRIDAATPLEEMVQELNAWQPVALAAYPSVLRQLAEEQIAGRLRIPLRHIATSAEILTEQIRRRVELAWNARVFDTYGATEYAPIASECVHGNKHLFEDGAIIEVVDRQGKAVPAGEAGDRVLLTIFGRRTQPLIRYELSDVLRVLPGACPCGRPFTMLGAIEGRVEDVLTFPGAGAFDGPVSIHPNVFHEQLEIVPASGWQVVHDSDGLTVNLTGLTDASWLDSIPSALRAALAARRARIPTLTVRRVTQLERGATGKAPLILSRIRR